MSESFISLFSNTILKVSSVNINLNFTSHDFISRCYGENHRYYHGQFHIRELLELHRRLLTLTGMSKIEDVQVELAIWYHDIIYLPKETDNEFKSSTLFWYLHPNMHFNVKDEVYCAIQETTHFEDISIQKPWRRYMLDLDLAGLGSSPAKFYDNTTKIRLENPHVDENTFNKNRKSFLTKLLNRGRPIFYNPYNLVIFNDLEKQAKINITHELANIDKQTDLI